MPCEEARADEQDQRCEEGLEVRAHRRPQSAVIRGVIWTLSPLFVGVKLVNVSASTMSLSEVLANFTTCT